MIIIDAYITELKNPLLYQQLISAIVFWSSIFIWRYLLKATIKELVDLTELKESGKGNDGIYQEDESRAMYRLAVSFWSTILLFSLITTHIITGTPVFNSDWIYLPSLVIFFVAVYELSVNDIAKAIISKFKR